MNQSQYIQDVEYVWPPSHYGLKSYRSKKNIHEPKSTYLRLNTIVTTELLWLKKLLFKTSYIHESKSTYSRP